MNQVTVKNLIAMAKNEKNQIEYLARVARDPREPKIYLHWSAGNYTHVYDDYTINITGDGTIYAQDLATIGEHTWCRNQGAIGVSMCCAWEANTRALGIYPPTNKQIEVMSQVIAALAEGLDIPIDIYHVMTHGEAADCEDGLEVHQRNGRLCEHYGPKSTCERWDLEYLGIDNPQQDKCNVYNPWKRIPGSWRGGDLLRAKANWYRKYWKEHGL